MRAKPDPIPHTVHKPTFCGTTLLKIAQIKTEPNEKTTAPNALKDSKKPLKINLNKNGTGTSVKRILKNVISYSLIRLCIYTTLNCMISE